jgi:hypothetical protein
MNGMVRSFVRGVAFGFVMLLVIGTISGRADATPVTGVGDVIASVDIPTAATCGGTTGGTAVAIVPGGKFGFPDIPILLVTSCIDAGHAKLFFLDPSTSPATLVQPTITTLVNPANGWGALAFRADQGDLLACTVSGTATAIYTINFSPFDSVADGTATLLLNGPNGSSCNGMTWDISNVSANGFQNAAIYLSPSSGAFVFRIEIPPPPAQPLAPTQIQSGCNGSVTGMGVAGRSLFVSCPPSQGGSNASIRQLNKDPSANGALVRTFTGPTTSPRGLSADPVSFGSEYKDVLWNKDQSVAVLEATYIPGGTIGQALGTPVAFPAACPASYPTQPDGTPLDSDGDGLLDCWEDGTLWSDGLPGINFSGVWPATLPATPTPPPPLPPLRDVTLCVTNAAANPPVLDVVPACASKLNKDLFVEIDWMGDAVAGFSHNPDASAPNAIPSVVAAFATAPVPIRLHVERSEPIPENPKTALVPCTPSPVTGDANFDALKAQYFGNQTQRTSANALNAKHFSFRYGVFVHNQSGPLNTSTGCAEIGGDDFMVSLGSWAPFNFGTTKKPVWHNVGTLDQQSGTFMHEFGHTLNLRHGGGDSINCKPNYQSVMNYTMQFSSPVNLRPLDYSRQALPTLDKTILNEAQGVGALAPGASPSVAFGPVLPGAKVTVALAGGAIDWNGNGVTTDTVSLDINQTTDATGGCPMGQGQFLEGFDDWANIQYNLRASVDFAAGAQATQEPNKGHGNVEISLNEALNLSLDKIDIKPADPNNLISVKNSQTISVAIFSRSGDAPLDATTVDPSTVTLRGTDGFTWVVPVKQNTQGAFQCKAQDVNSDGLPDLVCQFTLVANTISLAEKRAVLDGATFTEQPVHSSDFIKPN